MEEGWSGANCQELRAISHFRPYAESLRELSGVCEQGAGQGMVR